MQVFVDKVGLGVYKFQDVWQQPPLRRHILEVFWSNPGVTYSLRHSNLPLDKRTLEVAVTKAVSALVDSFQVSCILTILYIFCATGVLACRYTVRMSSRHCGNTHIRCNALMCQSLVVLLPVLLYQNMPACANAAVHQFV